MRKIRRMMMPPPPPAFAIAQGNSAGKSVNGVVFKGGFVPSIDTFESRIARQKLMMVSQELRSSIALAEMKQERFALRKESHSFDFPSSSPDVSAAYEKLVEDVLQVLDSVEEIVSKSVKKHSSSGTGTPLIASLGGVRFHDPDCIVVERIPKEKRLSFADRMEAERAGYNPCTICCSASGSLVGSREHSKVHHQSCISVKNINPDNAVSFSSKKEAFDLGFSPCKLCMHN